MKFCYFRNLVFIALLLLSSLSYEKKLKGKEHQNKFKACLEGQTCIDPLPDFSLKSADDTYSVVWNMFYQNLYDYNSVGSPDFLKTISTPYDKSFNIPIWKAKNKADCKNVCENFFNANRLKNKLFDWDCDYPQKDFQKIFNLDSTEYYMCYIKKSSKSRNKSIIETAFFDPSYPEYDKKFDVVYDISLSYIRDLMLKGYTEHGKYSLYYAKPWFPQYSFTSKKYCNWFCSLTNSICSSFLSRRNFVLYLC
jgi:hypothetical protein